MSGLVKKVEMEGGSAPGFGHSVRGLASQGAHSRSVHKLHHPPLSSGVLYDGKRGKIAPWADASGQRRSVDEKSGKDFHFRLQTNPQDLCRHRTNRFTSLTGVEKQLEWLGGKAARRRGRDLRRMTA